MSDDPYPTMVPVFPPAAHAGATPLPHDRQAPALRPPPADPEPVSPDCEGGKCKACTGGAWDERTDGPTPCRCKCH